MSKYDYVFFDLDGTISNSAEGIVNAAVYALKKLGIDETDRNRLERLIGPPLSESFPMYYGLSPEETTKAIKDFRHYYAEKGVLENEMYPDVEKLLIRLSEGGKTLAVATSKPEKPAREIIERYGIDKHFAYIAGASFDDSRAKKDQVIKYALETLNITEPSKVLMVGDRSHDVLGAAKHGIDCIGVLYGYGSRQELSEAGSLALAETVSQLGDIILSL
ncbi:MAG: HAD hydrolase-like protein [Clostridiales bacterium]|nr:HAD hydrolase-like protein [Clostridiales bacterium]